MEQEFLNGRVMIKSQEILWKLATRQSFVLLYLKRNLTSWRKYILSIDFHLSALYLHSLLVRNILFYSKGDDYYNDYFTFSAKAYLKNVFLSFIRS